MEVKPTKPSARGTATWFTGDVYIDALLEPQAHSRTELHFEALEPVTAAGHTNWHHTTTSKRVPHGALGWTFAPKEWITC